MATKAQTPTGKGFDSYFGYFDGYNDYLHSLSGTPCPGSRNVTYVDSKVGKTAIFEPFIYKMHYFTKTGSGQT